MLSCYILAAGWAVLIGDAASLLYCEHQKFSLVKCIIFSRAQVEVEMERCVQGTICWRITEAEHASVSSFVASAV